MSSDREALRLHSRYDPEKEAKRYIAAQSFSCNPYYVVITEPGESYLAKVLREAFPRARLVAIRYDKLLYRETDGLWDAVWRPGTGSELSSWLFSLIPDEYLPLTVFLPWKPSDSIWPSVSSYVWNGIASVIRLQSSVMYTRSAFGRRWLMNCVRNVITARRISQRPIIDKDIILAAAGPSLETLFPFDREDFFLCAVSSSLSCILSHGVKPDLCIATDGGYWALNHFRAMPSDIPAAFPCEAAIPNSVLERNPIEFLSYGSEIERSLLGITQIGSERAARNGTVSGTAALFLMEHSDRNVFAAGLDLCATDSYSHARPHASGPAMDARTERTKPLALALHESNRDTASLDMYAAWFSGRDESFKRRFFRVGGGGKPLTGIQSVSLGDLSSSAYRTLHEPYGAKGPSDWIPVATLSRLERKERVIEWIDGIRSRLVDSSTEITNDPVLTEVLQMVSFSGYLRHLKEVHGTSDTRSATKELRVDAIAYLDRLSSIVGRLRLT